MYRMLSTYSLFAGIALYSGLIICQIMMLQSMSIQANWIGVVLVGLICSIVFLQCNVYLLRYRIISAFIMGGGIVLSNECILWV